jgi:transcription-repair coupling factor (superfamily II helicase)
VKIATRAALKDRTVHADEGETFAGWEWLISLVHDTKASAFDYLQGETVLVVDEPAALETYLGNSYETLTARYDEMENADEIALRPDELYLTAEELRAGLERVPRVELRTLGRAAAMTDEQFAGEAEESSVRIGRATRATHAPMFLFPAVESAPEVAWSARAARRYHGRIAELAADVRRTLATEGARVLFAMPSAGVAERVAEMLAEYNVTRVWRSRARAERWVKGRRWSQLGVCRAGSSCRAQG